jgi:hypothetical protein
LKNLSKLLILRASYSLKTNQSMKKIILTVIFFICSCTGKVVDVKSPCVSGDDGPCGPKKPINDWWLKNSKNPEKQNS